MPDRQPDRDKEKESRTGRQADAFFHFSCYIHDENMCVSVLHCSARVRHMRMHKSKYNLWLSRIEEEMSRPRSWLTCGEIELKRGFIWFGHIWENMLSKSAYWEVAWIPSPGLFWPPAPISCNLPKRNKHLRVLLDQYSINLFNFLKMQESSTSSIPNATGLLA